MPETGRRKPIPKEFMGEDTTERRQKNKYAFQVGIRDVEFTIEKNKGDALGLTLPFQSVDQAENALRQKIITPVTFREDDETHHHVVVFDPRPVGFSGFMDCVIHSLTLTNHGLFEVGRYPAMSLLEQHRYWQWFLHQCLATSKQVITWQTERHLSPQQVVARFYEEMTDWM